MAAQSPIDATSLPHPRHPEPTSPHKPLRTKRTHFHFPTPAPPPRSRSEEPPLRAHANSPAEPVPAPATPQTAIYQTNPFHPVRLGMTSLSFSNRRRLFGIRVRPPQPPSGCLAVPHSPTPLCYPKFPGGPFMRTFFLCPIAVAAPAAVYQASVDQLTVVHGAAAADSAIHHSAPKSLRVEPGGQYPDALVRSAPVSLTIGKRYELSAWMRTDNLTVRDTDRSPIATGAALSMASMPFDVHSESLAGTRPWTRLSLRFTAPRAQDAILLAVANGCAIQGTAWFEGVSLDEASTTDAWPAREAVKTFGPAYRYPSAGWIYLHIEGKPYERGYQHGYLMAREIPEYLERCAADLGTNAAGWGALRTQASALFLRGFDREILEEMRGIADGASDAGTKWQGRRLDVDIVVSNITVELGE